MTPHGPDAPTFAAASAAQLTPTKFEAGLAFMFETNCMLRVARWAVEASHLDADYYTCWQGLPLLFDGTIGVGIKAARK
jgi:homogentisate 1,2-dioxygenase